MMNFDPKKGLDLIRPQISWSVKPQDPPDNEKDAPFGMPDEERVYDQHQRRAFVLPRGRKAPPAAPALLAVPALRHGRAWCGPYLGRGKGVSEER